MVEALGLPAVSERARKGTTPRPPTGHSLEKKRMLKASPLSLGITKAENYKTKYKGENQRCERAIRSPVLGPGAPCPVPWVPRWGSFRFLPPGARRLRGDSGGQLPPMPSAPVLLHRWLCPGCSSHLVVNVGWALGGHLLDDVDGVPVVPAHLLVVRAVVVLCSP